MIINLYSINILNTKLRSLLVNEIKLFKMLISNNPNWHEYRFEFSHTNDNYIISQYSKDNGYHICKWNKGIYTNYTSDTHELVLQQLIKQVETYIKYKAFI